MKRLGRGLFELSILILVAVACLALDKLVFVDSWESLGLGVYVAVSYIVGQHVGTRD